MENNYAVDTNIILRFLLFDEANPKQSQFAKKIFASAVNGTHILFISDIVISEVCHVLEDAYKIKKQDISDYLKDLLSLENIKVDNPSIIFTCLDIYVETNCDFEDAYIYTTMFAKDIDKIFTFDQKHFKKFNGIELFP